MNSNTAQAYNNIVQKAQHLFMQKMHDYGTSWRVLRNISVVDQVYIKVKRICTLQETSTSRVEESIDDEWIGVLNYSVVGLVQLVLGSSDEEDMLSAGRVEELYNNQIKKAYELMQNKNHDYGEAWRDMMPKSIADICMMKVLRMRQILSNKQKLKASEGLDANYLDLINYAIFYLINNVTPIYSKI